MLCLNMRFLTAASTSHAPIFSCPLCTAACTGFIKRYEFVPTYLLLPCTMILGDLGEPAVGVTHRGTQEGVPVSLQHHLWSHKSRHRLGREMSRLPSREWREGACFVVTLKGVKLLAPPEVTWEFLLLFSSIWILPYLGRVN